MGLSFHVTIEKDENGWFIVRCVELPAAISQGRTREEAIELVLEELGPAFKGKEVSQIEVAV